ncbi:hypothetical protein SAMN04488125_11072 [Methylorubrum salsuginis]|uniref:Uncharacterized protein n=1 Tax=Methylorubrum salsuginis TaxID=414703 RepID=A0A1I4FMA2_9HYPH|nr:hypothetical protein SAMN04488125_11072 [Methylorubrum salsuginis]
MNGGAKGQSLQAGPEAQGQTDAAGGNPTAANASDSAGKRGRQMMNGVKRAHGWRVQEGKRDGG